MWYNMPMAYTYHYCPQCARPLEEHLSYGRVRKVCPACEFIHFRNPKVGAGGLVERGEELLLLLRPPDDIFGPDTWSIPAGFVEHNESPREAAACEVKRKLEIQEPKGDITHVYSQC